MPQYTQVASRQAITAQEILNQNIIDLFKTEESFNKYFGVSIEQQKSESIIGLMDDTDSYGLVRETNEKGEIEYKGEGYFNALQTAIFYGNLPGVEFLIKMGANPNLATNPERKMGLTNLIALTPLQLTSLLEEPKVSEEVTKKIFETLLNHGANSNLTTKDCKFNPLEMFKTAHPSTQIDIKSSKQALQINRLEAARE